MPRFYLLLNMCLVSLFLCLTPAPQAQAQVMLPTGGGPEDAGVTLPDELTPEAANALLSRLSDSEVRQLLLDQLNMAASDSAGTSSGLGEFFYHTTTGAFGAILVAVERLPILFSSQMRAFTNFYDTMGADGLFRFAWLFALVLIGAAAVEFGFRHLTRSWRSLPPVTEAEPPLRTTISGLTKRLVVEIVAVGVFIGAAIFISGRIMPEEWGPLSGLIGFNLIALPRIGLAIGRFFMAPDSPDYRLVHATDATARAIVFHNFWLAVLIGAGQFFIQFNAMNGVPMGETRLGFWINLAVHLYLALLVWRYRTAMTDMMRGPGEVTPAEEWVARAYPYFVIAVSAVTWWIVNIMVSYEAFELLRTAPHYKTLILASFAPAMDTAIRGLVRHLVPPMAGEGPVAERAYHATKRSYIRIGRVLVFGLVLVQVANFWGMNPRTIAEAGVGAQLAADVIEFLIIMSFGYLIYEAVSLWINRKLAAEYTSSGYDPDNADFGGDGGGAGGSRLSTVLPLILMVSRVTIVIIFVLLGLSNVGIDTTPLLAGAGIVGLAIGFGAQKLVTDVVSGIFFLVDDAFRTGEYVEIEGTMGTVEKISIRSMQLRHHKGPVHTIPYGEIPKITNFSRDWVIMKLRFTVPFDTDPNRVKKIFKKIGAEMLEHPELGEDFLQPFKSQGVLEIDDVGMVIRGKFMAKPGKQFMIRKEIFNRVSAAFAENGIDFARREVRVALPGLDHRSEGELTDEDKAAIAAAATQAAQEQMAEGAGKADDR